MFWRKIWIRKNKKNHLIPLKKWNIYLKNLYQSPHTMDTIFNSPIEDYIFYLGGIDFEVKKLANGKATDIEGYQAKFFKME